MNKYDVIPIFLIPVATFLLSYFGYWYLTFVVSIIIGYLLISKIKYILFISALSLITFFLSFNIKYSFGSLALFSEISGIPDYLVLLITFLIVFALNTGGMMVGSSINNNA